MKLDQQDQGKQNPQDQGGNEGQMEDEEPVYQDIRYKGQREEEAPEEEEETV